ncbi:MAG: hypothetical protein ABSD31_01980 [Candidatus Binataceae bacterium]|jgi:hypothetical protein
MALMMLCAACSVPATINTKPFDQFSNAAQQLDLGADQAFANGVTFTEAGFVAQAAADPNFPIPSLLVTRTSEGFATIGQQPTFMEIRKAATTLSSANKLLVEYAGSLQQLASPGLVSEATFDQLAKDLDTSSTKVISDLKATANTPSAQEIGLFSAAAAEAARLYIEHKRQEDLVKVIQLNQPAIDSFSRWCQGGVEHLETDFYTAYSNQMNTLSTQLGGLGKANAKNVAARRALIQQMVQLDGYFLDSESTLSALDNSYKAVPKAHKNLETAIQSPTTALGDIQVLYDEARQVQTLSKQLESNSAKTATPVSAAKAK